MLFAWSGSVSELKFIANSRCLSDFIECCFIQSYGYKPNPTEIASWGVSLPSLLSILHDDKFDKIQVIIELQMPIGTDRADVVLLGGTAMNRKALIVELKQWSNISVDTDTLNIFVRGLGRCQHPSQQALNYSGKLRHFHSIAESYDNVDAITFLHNMPMSELQKLQQVTHEPTSQISPLFGMDDSKKINDYICNKLLPCELNTSEHKFFCEGKYSQANRLFDIINKNAQDISNNATLALATKGFGLTDEQEFLLSDILLSAKNKKNNIFVIQGFPGSGKTLLAVFLLLQAMQNHVRSVLAIRNNRLHAILKKCFDSVVPGASGALIYFEMPKTQTGIGDAHFNERFDLVICDEAQRMRSTSIQRALERAPTSVVFLDESQRLNPPEQGTLVNFVQAAKRAGKETILRSLNAVVRCRGGRFYHEWVDTLLGGHSRSTELRSLYSLWRNQYPLRVCSSIESLVDGLARERDACPDRRVAIVASFTESPGNSSNLNALDNLRVGYPLSSGWDGYLKSRAKINWLMKPSEYVDYWTNNSGNSLNKAASVYGSQGFESDYVGIIWGRDFVIREGRWHLGNPDFCYDTIDGLIQRGRKKDWCSEAIILLKNRYRIFLTRGIFGAYLYCEDEETHEFFKNFTT